MRFVMSRQKYMKMYKYVNKLTYTAPILSSHLLYTNVTANQLCLLSCQPFSDASCYYGAMKIFRLFYDSGRERDKSNMSKTIKFIY